MRVVEAFRESYGVEPLGVWHAPGRVNLIGEHTDYNDGFVLPFAVPWGVTAAVAPRDGRRHPAAVAPGGRAADHRDPRPGRGLGRYVVGVFWVLREAGHPVRGADLVVDGDVPQGAGLSSSAALEWPSGPPSTSCTAWAS